MRRFLERGQNRPAWNDSPSRRWKNHEQVQKQKNAKQEGREMEGNESITSFELKNNLRNRMRPRRFCWNSEACVKLVRSNRNAAKELSDLPGMTSWAYNALVGHRSEIPVYKLSKVEDARLDWWTSVGYAEQVSGRAGTKRYPHDLVSLLKVWAHARRRFHVVLNSLHSVLLCKLRCSG